MNVGQVTSQTEKGFGKTLESIITNTCKYLNILGIGFLLIMTVLTVCDVVGRVFKYPIVGSTEITEYLMVTITFLCLSWCAIKGRMITVDLITTRLSKRVNAVLNTFTLFIGFWFMVVLSWQSYVATLDMQTDNLYSFILHIPSAPFMWILSVGFSVLSVVMAMQFIQNLTKAVGK
jgi:TRAP-type C4-dicarboxylate transport system permease small subunit